MFFVSIRPRRFSRRRLLFEAFWQRLSLDLVGVNGCPPKKRAAPTKSVPSARSELVEPSPSCVLRDGEGRLFKLSHQSLVLPVGNKTVSVSKVTAAIRANALPFSVAFVLSRKTVLVPLPWSWGQLYQQRIPERECNTIGI